MGDDGMMEKPNAAKQARAASRGGTKPAIWRVDGTNFTYAELAKVLGISLASAKWRMQCLKGASGAITIERLRAMGP